MSAPSCRGRRYCSPPGCFQLPITADADARPSPSLSSPPLASLSVSPPPKPRAQRVRGREAPASGLTSDLRALRREDGAGGEWCGEGGGAASWRALPAPGLEAGLILELVSSPTSLSGLEDHTNVVPAEGRAWCRLRGTPTHRFPSHSHHTPAQRSRACYRLRTDEETEAHRG